MDLTNIPMATPPVEHSEVLVVPWGLNEPGGAKRAAGLFDADGNYLREGACLRYGEDPLSIEPEFILPEKIETIAGRWLYGGMLYGHFGHFLCESTSRLWGLADCYGQFDGVIWLPKIQMGHAARLVRPYAPFFTAIGFSGTALRAPQSICRIEKIVIPEQGFGIGMMASGRPQYRDFMRQNLGKDIAPDGPSKIYVSRSKLPTKRGSVLVEKQIERQMQDEGYDIFHPEDYSLAEQISRYKAASHIVGLDGSALHLAGMTVSPGAKVAILNRGPSQNIDDYARQFQHFCGIEVEMISAVSAYWFQKGRRVVKRETHAELDLVKVGRALAEAGFVSSKPWEAAQDSEIASEVSDREARTGKTMQRYGGA